MFVCTCIYTYVYVCVYISTYPITMQLDWNFKTKVANKTTAYKVYYHHPLYPPTKVLNNSSIQEKNNRI